MKKSVSLLLVAMMFLALVLTGCTEKPAATTQEGPTAATQETSVAPADTADAAVPTVEKRTDLRVASVALEKLDPHASTLASSIQLFIQLYDSLINLQDDGTATAALAETWENNDGGDVWTFHLRKDAKFQNGEPVSASDVVYSINRAMTISNMAGYVKGISEVKALDDYTVQITLDAMNAAFLINLYSIKILSEKAVTAAGDDFAQQITDAGTGPYKVTKWEPDAEVILEANEDYFGGAPSIKTIYLEVIADASARLIALETGEVDFIEAPTANWEEINGSGKYKTLLPDTTKCCYMAVNCYRPDSVFAQDIRLRQAVQYALDKETINKVAYGGLGEVAVVQPNPKYILGSDTNVTTYSYNPEKAKQLIAEAGYPNGIEDAGIILVPNTLFFPKVAQVVQSQLEAVGLKLKIELVESATASATAKTGAYDVYINRNTFMYDMVSFSRLCHSSNTTSVVKYGSTELDSYFDGGERTMDPVERASWYHKALEFLQVYSAHLSLFYTRVPYACDPNLNPVIGPYYYHFSDWTWS